MLNMVVGTTTQCIIREKEKRDDNVSDRRNRGNDYRTHRNDV